MTGYNLSDASRGLSVAFHGQTTGKLLLTVAILALASCASSEQIEADYQEMAEACRKSGGVPQPAYVDGRRFFNKCVYFNNPAKPESGAR